MIKKSSCLIFTAFLLFVGFSSGYAQNLQAESTVNIDIEPDITGTTKQMPVMLEPGFLKKDVMV